MGLSRTTLYYDRAPDIDVVLQKILSVTQLKLFVHRDNNSVTLSMNQFESTPNSIKLYWVYKRSDLDTINKLDPSRRAQFFPEKQHIIFIETRTLNLKYLLKTILWILRREYHGIDEDDIDGYTFPTWIGKSYEEYLNRSQLLRIKEWFTSFYK